LTRFLRDFVWGSKIEGSGRRESMKIIKKIKKATAGKNREAASIGIIGLTEEQKEQQEEFMKRFEEKLEFCRKNAIPQEKKVSGIELKNHILEEYGAGEKEFPERQKQMFKEGLLYTLHPEIFPESCFPPKNGRREAVLKWARNHDQKEISDIARGTPDEKYGLQFSYLEIPERKIRFDLELNTGCMQISSEGDESIDLFGEIVLWQGITKEDIENETDAFRIFADEYYRSARGNQL
jgi:hypothetical protein